MKKLDRRRIGYGCSGLRNHRSRCPDRIRCARREGTVLLDRFGQRVRPHPDRTVPHLDLLIRSVRNRQRDTDPLPTPAVGSVSCIVPETPRISR